MKSVLVDGRTTIATTIATTTATGAVFSGRPRAALRTGLVPTAAVGTSAGPILSSWDVVLDLVTSTPEFGPSAPRDPAVEIRQLRDRICLHGLTKLDIARAVGVDRRSLSAWVNGEMRPAADRLAVLGVFDDLVEAIDAEHPGRAREILLTKMGGSALIDRVATERSRLLMTWRSLTRPEAVGTRTVSDPAGVKPIWAAAAQAAAKGRLKPLPSERTVRSADTYEMDLDEAKAFVEPELKVRRRGFR